MHGQRARAARGAALLGALAALSGCGGSGDGGATEGERPPEQVAAGRTVFLESCGGCHTLADAGTTGTIGPVLDGRQLSVERVEDQVRGGGGAMPPFEGRLSEAQITGVSAYVADASG